MWKNCVHQRHCTSFSRPQGFHASGQLTFIGASSFENAGNWAIAVAGVSPLSCQPPPFASRRLLTPPRMPLGYEHRLACQMAPARLQAPFWVWVSACGLCWDGEHRQVRRPLLPHLHRQAIQFGPFQACPNNSQAPGNPKQTPAPPNKRQLYARCSPDTPSGWRSRRWPKCLAPRGAFGDGRRPHHQQHRYDRWLQRELAKKTVAGAAASLTASGWSPVTLNTRQMFSPTLKVPFNWNAGIPARPTQSKEVSASNWLALLCWVIGANSWRLSPKRTARGARAMSPGRRKKASWCTSSIKRVSTLLFWKLRHHSEEPPTNLRINAVVPTNTFTSFNASSIASACTW